MVPIREETVKSGGILIDIYVVVSDYGGCTVRIGYAVSTMVFWGRENNLSFEQECEFLRSHGFGVELWPTMKDSGDCRFARRNWARLAAATKDMLVALRSRTDHPSLEHWSEQIECARMLDAQIVADLASLGIGKGVDSNGSDFCEQVVAMAERNNVKLCVETGRLPVLKKVGEKFESVWFCLDTGFANLGKQFGFKQYVDELAPRVAHLHLTDNYGQRQDHQPPGLRGGMPQRNWDYLLSVLSKYDNDVVATFEMCPTMPAVMLRQGCEFLFEHLKWPDRPRKMHVAAGVSYNPV